jgi:hypothetical protein
MPKWTQPSTQRQGTIPVLGAATSENVLIWVQVLTATQSVLVERVAHESRKLGDGEYLTLS